MNGEKAHFECVILKKIEHAGVALQSTLDWEEIR